MKLGEIIDLAALQSIQDCFAKSTGFAAITVDYRGRPLLEYSGFTVFCENLRKDPYYNEKCYQSDAHGSIESVRRNAIHFYRCHAGLVDFAIPIMVEGEYVASVMCGQIMAIEGENIDAELLMPSKNIFKKNPHLQEFYDNIPTIPFDRIKETANLLYLTLNYMVEQYILNRNNLRLVNEQKERVELEKQFKELELKFYHSQINPHFLFNALNVAGRQAFLENAEKTQDIIYALADMYRYYLNNSGFMITLEDEIQNLHNYFFIQSIRFGELLQFNVKIDDKLKDYYLPAMSLQTFAENSVRHGLEPKEEMGFVKIRGQSDGDMIKFTITDNGVGIDKEKLSLLNNRDVLKNPHSEISGMGVYNIHKRLLHFFNENFVLNFSVNENGETVVTLTVPVTESGKKS